MRGHGRFLPRALLAAGTVALVIGGALLADHLYGHTGSAPVSAARTLPAALRPRAAPSSTDLPAAPAVAGTSTPALAPTPAVAPDRPGIPVEIQVPSHGLSARITTDPLMQDGFVYVPRDPRVVSWTSGTGSAPYSAPGSNRGTVMLVSHINYAGVAGAFHDLATYRPGQQIVLLLADGRRLSYTVAAAPVIVSKTALAADLAVPGEPLHARLFNQAARYGPAGGPLSGRLLLQSCGGPFDNRDGNYEDNVFVFALPDQPAP